MHGALTRRRARQCDESGAIAIIVAASLTGLLVVVAMVLDFGLLRIDRQIDRSAADAATLAGLHGLDTGDGIPHPYVGVCSAIRYLKANSSRFSTAAESAGWSNGVGTATANGCADTSLRNKACRPTDKTSWARWHWAGSSGGVTLDVTIESGYDLSAPANQWTEDSLPATSGDNGDPAYQGCDHLAVTITQSRRPGLGSLATSSDLTTAIRSVGRVKSVPGDSAPAMLLLKRTGCPVLKTGSNGGGSFIHILGAVASNGLSQGGSIHSDSDGVGCNGGNNSWVFGGLAANGIVAYAAPLASNPTSPDPTKPGTISSVAVANGLTGSRVRDAFANVYSSSAISGTSGSTFEVAGRSLTTRRLVDERYFSAVKGAISGASATFTAGTPGPPDTSWKRFPEGVDACKPTPADVSALSLTAADSLYVDCNNKFVGDGAGNVLDAGTVYFRGWVNPAGPLKLPHAHHVYIGNHTNVTSAISLGTGAEFQVRTAGTTDVSGNCSSGQSSNKAILFVRTGEIKQTSGLLRMCRTTAVMMGGRSDGCVPSATGTAPTATPCLGVNGDLGTGQFTQNGGDIDWTAPDTLDVTIDTTGNPSSEAIAAWADPNGPEDLALWSESATNANNTFNMAGGGLFRVRGVFMVPNAAPFIISGGASLNLVDAQYVATSIELNGSGTNITMAVDPSAGVTLPDQGLVGLVR